MPRPSSRFLSVLAVLLVPRLAQAQACCAGSGAVTPGRLGLHDDALAAAQLKVAHVYASFDRNGHYTTPAHGASEQDLEQDLIGSVRLPYVDRAQLAVLVPFVETRRAAQGSSGFGGGVGDVNLSARYDFLYAGQRRWIPGFAALAGITFPSGRSPESSTNALATDSTGVGAFQGNFGLSVEQSFGPWLVSLYGIVAKRAARTVHDVRSTLGTQWTALASAAYVFRGDYALALSASYTAEGNAEVASVESPNSARRQTIVALTGVVPLTDHLRLQGGLNANPPVPSLGKNQIATVGLLVTGVYTWY